MHAGNLRSAWQQLKELGSSSAGRDQIREAMQLCHAADLANDEDVDQLAQWAKNSFDYLVSLVCLFSHPVMHCDGCLLRSCTGSVESLGLANTAMQGRAASLSGLCLRQFCCARVQDEPAVF